MSDNEKIIYTFILNIIYILIIYYTLYSIKYHFIIDYIHIIDQNNFIIINIKT